MNFSRMGKNARLGDGMIREGKYVGAITFISTDLSLLQHKEKLLNREGVKVTTRKTQESGYGGKKTIHVYSTTSNKEIKEATSAATDDILMSLDKEDLYLWYLDDGSWHKGHDTMHLYSNMLNDKESMILIDKIDVLYGIKPRLRIDRKKDGRQFYYLYFPRELVKLIRPEIAEYIRINNLKTLFYKVGGESYIDKPEKLLLTDEEVRSIRSLYKGKRGDVSVIAEQMGISYNRVYGVAQNKTYKDVI